MRIVRLETVDRGKIARGSAALAHPSSRMKEDPEAAVKKKSTAERNIRKERELFMQRKSRDYERMLLVGVIFFVAAAGLAAYLS